MIILFSDALIFGSYAACIFIVMDRELFFKQYYGNSSSSPYYWLIDNTGYPVPLLHGAEKNYGPWWEAYIWAQFFATGTLSTLAPGPFARNPIEVVRIL